MSNEVPTTLFGRPVKTVDEAASMLNAPHGAVVGIVFDENWLATLVQVAKTLNRTDRDTTPPQA